MADKKRNITLCLPTELIQAAKLLAVQRGVSLSGLLTDYLQQIVEETQGYQRASRRIKQRLNQGLDMGTGGSISWNRDSLYER